MRMLQPFLFLLTLLISLAQHPLVASENKENEKKIITLSKNIRKPFQNITNLPPQDDYMYEEKKNKVSLEKIKILWTIFKQAEILTEEDIKSYKSVGGSEEELEVYFKIYRQKRPFKEYIDKERSGDKDADIDPELLRILKFSRQDIREFSKKIAVKSPPKKKKEKQELTEDDLKEIESTQKNILEENLKLSKEIKGDFSFYDIENHITDQIQQYISKLYNEDKKISALSFQYSVFLMLKPFVEGKYYNWIVSSKGYLCIFPTGIHKNWKDIKGRTNKERLEMGYNLVDGGAESMELHHVSQFGPESLGIALKKFKELLEKSCKAPEAFSKCSVIMLYLSKKGHDREGIHPKKILNKIKKPDRIEFNKDRIDINKQIREIF